MSLFHLAFPPFSSTRVVMVVSLEPWRCSCNHSGTGVLVVGLARLNAACTLMRTLHACVATAAHREERALI
jgi:hypothetical protein